METENSRVMELRGPDWPYLKLNRKRWLFSLRWPFVRRVVTTRKVLIADVFPDA